MLMLCLKILWIWITACNFNNKFWDQNSGYIKFQHGKLNAQLKEKMKCRQTTNTPSATVYSVLKLQYTADTADAFLLRVPFLVTGCELVAGPEQGTGREKGGVSTRHGSHLAIPRCNAPVKCVSEFTGLGKENCTATIVTDWIQIATNHFIVGCLFDN